MLGWILGCSAPTTPTGDAPATVPDSGATPTGASGDTAATVPTGDTGPPVETFDCATVADHVLGITEMPGARGYHDVGFDADGTIFGNTYSGDELLKADYAGNTGVFVPGIGTIQQIAALPDGDFAVATDVQGIVRVRSDGGSTSINANVYAYGLVLGPDGRLWAADQDTVQRIDPDTGDAELVVPRGALASGSPRVLNFTLGYDKLVMGTLGGSQGRLYAVDLDASFDPTGPPYEFASGLGTGAYHDAMGVDVCGYLYVPDYESADFYRVSPDGGVVVKLLESTGILKSDYVHGLDWGTGLGGWRTDALYMTQPYHQNHVQEVVIGVPSRDSGVVGVNLP